MLDQLAAGAITALDTPLQCLVTEAEEEAALDPAFVRHHARSLGTCAFTSHRADGCHKGNVMLLFDIELDGQVPRVLAGNDEVAEFTLMSEHAVIKSIFAGEWKPQAAVVTIDFLIRHGRITPHTDARFVDVCAALCSDLGCLSMPRYA